MTLNENSPPAPPRRQRGFTLFELIIVACIVALSGGFAYDRFRDLQEDAEQAAALQNLMGLKSAVRIRAAELIAANRWDELRALPSRNPFDLLDELPTAYCGETAVGFEQRRSGCWYYLRPAGQVSYRPSHRGRFETGAGEGEMRFVATGVGADGAPRPGSGIVDVKLLPLEIGRAHV